MTHHLSHGFFPVGAVSIKFNCYCFRVKAIQINLNIKQVEFAMCFKFDLAETKRLPFLSQIVVPISNLPGDRTFVRSAFMICCRGWKIVLFRIFTDGAIGRNWGVNCAMLSRIRFTQVTGIPFLSRE